MSGIVGYLNNPVRIVAGADAPGSKEWTFDNLGNIRLPQGGNILNYSGNSVLSSPNTGNITFDTNTIGNVEINTVINIETSSVGYGNLNWSFSPDGKLTLPNIGQIAQNFSVTKTTTSDIIDPSTPTVIWTAENIFISTVKMLIMLEQDNIAPLTFTITNNGTGNYVINSQVNPTLNLVRGQTYTFNINASGHPFWIKTALSLGDTADVYNNGVGNNGDDNGIIDFTVPLDAPDTLYYNCQYHTTMRGTINILPRYQTQSCEAIISARGSSGTGNDIPLMSVYGITYTGATSLVSFTVQRNITTNFIEVLATLNDTLNPAYLRIYSVELTSRD